ncbi:hypothetical protein V2J09_004623 [Rumex salicifolius]
MDAFFTFRGIFGLFLLSILIALEANGEIPMKTLKAISYANRKGNYVGIVIPNTFEMNPLLQSSNFSSSFLIDFAGRRFRFGTIEEKKVILVMTGLGMVNAGVTTQLLLSLFNIKGVVHYGIAGNANPSLNIGDVTIPKYWAHTGLWNWQRYGDGPGSELSLESNGDYTREIGFLRFANFTTTKSESDNLLNSVWYQREEVFPVDGVPEQRQHVFWLPVNSIYLNLSKTLLQDVKLEGCINSTTCLTTPPKVTVVERGVSADTFVDNAAYRSFIYDKFNVTPVDMETAAVALICHQQKKPFIAFRALSDLAGGGSADSNEAAVFSSLAVDNSIKVVLHFIRSL